MAPVVSSLRSEPRSLLVSERFVSLQGEGISSGAPAAFLRLGQCNLSCSFCDTPYTWDAERHDLSAELRRVPFAELIQWAAEAVPGRLIITGGEPMIQQKQLAAWIVESDEAQAIAKRARPTIEVETNGTIAPFPDLAARIDQWNVSPKLENSRQAAEQAIRPAALRSLIATGRAYFKFVIADDRDALQARRLMDDLGLSSDRVLFMPLASTAQELRQASPRVAELALRARVRFSSRLHLELFGGGRGV